MHTSKIPAAPTPALPAKSPQGVGTFSLLAQGQRPPNIITGPAGLRRKTTGQSLLGNP